MATINVLLIIFGIVFVIVFVAIAWKKIGQLFVKVVGTKYERDVKRMQPIIDLVTGLEPEMEKLSDAQLRAKTDEFRTRMKEIYGPNEEEMGEIENEFKYASLEERMRLKKRLNELRDEALSEVLPHVFAVVREAARRTIGMRHYDMQIMGGLVLHEGRIAEMATGEGKTLAATLPLYLNALLGKGCHLVTVNDYLAKRDRYWMGPIFEFLGLTVGYIQHDMSSEERKKAYACDVTYGTNNEFGFDYLRDNMAIRPEHRVQRPFCYAIVDEVDSILVDEARTPLIISGLPEDVTDLYYQIDRLIPYLKKSPDDFREKGKEEEYKSKGMFFDYVVEEKEHNVVLTEQGIAKCENLLKIESLYDDPRLVSHINQALRAHNLFHKDKDYMVKDGKVIIVDEFTGRLMPGRRWSDGLHQAIEAKERVRIEKESQTLATITFQNYFRLYQKLAGMTGTAETEAAEFENIYGLDVMILPTNRPLIREQYTDVIYKTEKEKFRAVVDEIMEMCRNGRPVLVGTRSIEKSEKLSKLLKDKDVPHNVLNAKYHEREAYIVAQAGRKGAVTIATNMAGRGTDIVLGGNPEFMARDVLCQRGIEEGMDGYDKEMEKLMPEFKDIAGKEHALVVERGGLHIIGTERHDARRIDNQLRGRSGRQGDPGSSRFYLALDDELMRLFGGQRIAAIMERLNIPEDEPIAHPWIAKSVESAQKKIEAHNFEIRKQLLEFDDVMNKQREVIYAERNKILEGENLKEDMLSTIGDLISDLIEIYAPKDAHSQDWDMTGLDIRLKQLFDISVRDIDLKGMSQSVLADKIVEIAKSAYVKREELVGEQELRGLERMVMLQVVDMAWKDHLHSMDKLREGIGLRGYAQKDPIIEYKTEGYAMFSDMLGRIKQEVLQFLFHFKAKSSDGLKRVVMPAVRGPAASRGNVSKTVSSASSFSADASQNKFKVGRNDPCPCGSGKKYKRCCGKE